MNSSLLIASSSGLFFALGGVIYKASNKHLIKNPLRYLLIYSIFRTVVIMTLLPWVSFSLPEGLVLTFLFYALSIFLGTLLTGLGLVHLDASVFMPLFNLQLIFTPLLAFFFLNERLSLVGYFLIFIVLLGGFLVTFSEGSKRRRAIIERLVKKFWRRDFNLPISINLHSPRNLKVVLITFVAGLVFYSMSDNLSGRLLRQWDVFSLVFWGGLLQLPFSFFLIPFIKGREEVKPLKLWPIFLAVVFGFFGLLAVNVGFSFNVSLSQALSRLSSVYTLVIVVILARFKGEFLERHPTYVYVVRFLGSGVMVVAAAGLLILK